MSTSELAPLPGIDAAVQQPGRIDVDASVACGCVILLICVLIGYWRSSLDAVVVVSSMVMVQGAMRRSSALAFVLLLPAAFPPWEFPCYGFCMTPLVWMWHSSVSGETARPFSEKKATVGRGRAGMEGVIIGFAAAWLSSGFLRDALWSRGWIIQGVACLAFGLQWGVVALTIRATRGMRIGRAAFVMATVATIAEWIQVRWGVAWPVMGLSVAVSETSLAQWAAIMGPFGLSWCLYLVNFMLVWNPAKIETDMKVRPILAGKGVSSASRWRGPLTSALLLSSLWLGGRWIEKTTPIGQLPFSALMVQPRVLLTEKSQVESLQVIDRLTVASLKDYGPVDLVIWPEGCVLPSPHPALMAPTSEVIPADRWDLIGVHHKFRTRYQSAGLFGVNLARTRQVQRFGLPIDETQLFNAAVLLDRAGAMRVHEKLSLVPLKEGLPSVLDTVWFRRTVLPVLGLEAPLTAGDKYQNLEFTTREGKSIRIAVCICYESLHPGLPQFDPTQQVDAIVHLLYDGHFVSHPEWIERHLMACRARAIETRTWSLVCSTCAGSAIIDPRGTIRGQCPDAECVLRSDSMAYLP